MKQTIIEKLKKHQILLLTILVAVLGVAIFIYIYGIEILKFTNDAWLFSAEDLTQHYYGWVFFRNADWAFPIGLFNTLSYQNYASIIFTDSIPLFAIIFKVISNILPARFQYFGIYGLLCYTLQGIFAFILLRKFIKSKLYCIIGTIFFIVSPVLMQRMFIHTALSSHFLLLMALCIFAYRDKYKERPKIKIILWTLTFLLCVSIHLYYIPIVVIIALGTFIAEYIEDKKTWKTSILAFVISCTIALILLYILGGFTNSTYLNDGMNYYNANLNIFINSQGYSRFIERLPMATDGEFEAFGYLGLGIIFLSTLGIALYLIKHHSKKEWAETLKNPNIIGVIVCIVFGMLLAMGTSVKIGGHILFNIPYPGFIVKLLAMFRATGRFAILPYYLIFLVAMYLVDRNISQNKANIIIIVCLLIQLIDINPKGQNKIEYKKEEYEFEHEAWEEILAGYEHIIYLSNPYYIKEDTFKLAYIASENDCTLNNYYFARKVEGKEEETEEILKSLQDGNMQEDTIYIINKSDWKRNRKYQTNAV